MRYKVIITLFYFFFLLSCSDLLAQKGDYGFPGMIYYFVSNARSFGLAGADVTIDDDVKMMLNNPAGLGSISKRQLSFSYSNLLLESKYYNVFFAYPNLSVLDVYFTVGMGLILIEHGKFLQRDFFNRKIGTFEISENACNVSIAIQNESSVSFGMNIKFYNRTFSGLKKDEYWSAKSKRCFFSIDFGGITEHNIGKDFYLKFGAKLGNIGKQKVDQLPIVIKAGVELLYDKRERVNKPDNEKYGGRILPNIEYLLGHNGEVIIENFSLGGEVWVRVLQPCLFFGRIGFNERHERCVLGGGLNYNFEEKKNLILDFSMMPIKYYDDISGLDFPEYRLTLTMRF